MNNKGVAYIRVSALMGRDKTGDFLSPQVQLESVREYFASKGIEFDEALSLQYQDIDVSGFRGDWKKRPGLSKLMADARAGKFAHVGFFKLSRLARSAKQGLIIIDELKEAKTQLHFVKDDIDTNTPSGQLIMSIMLSISQMESQNTSEFVKAAIAEKQKNDFWGKYPFWITRNEQGEYCLHPVMGPVARLICDKALEGLSSNKIAKYLNQNGYRTPQNTIFRTQTINRFFTVDGIERLQGYAFKMTSKGINDKIGRIFPAVITDSEADTLTVLIGHAERKKASGTKRKLRSYVGAGIIRCAVCGLNTQVGSSTARSNDTVPNPKREQTISYVCNGAHSGHPAHIGVPGFTICTDNADDALVRVLRTKLKEPPAPAEKEVFRPEPERTPEKIKAEMALLLDMFLDQKVHPDIYTAKQKKLSDELEELAKASEPTSLETIRTVLTETEDEKAAWNGVAKTLVESVTFPHDWSTRTRWGKAITYRCLKVKLKTGEVYLSPCYKGNFTGERVVVRVDE